MSPRYLFDINILSDIIKRPDGAVVRKITALEDGRVEENVFDEYARLRTLREKAGTPIGGTIS